MSDISSYDIRILILNNMQFNFLNTPFYIWLIIADIDFKHLKVVYIINLSII